MADNPIDAPFERCASLTGAEVAELEGAFRTNVQPNETIDPEWIESTGAAGLISWPADFQFSDFTRPHPDACTRVREVFAARLAELHGRKIPLQDLKANGAYLAASWYVTVLVLGEPPLAAAHAARLRRPWVTVFPE